MKHILREISQLEEDEMKKYQNEKINRPMTGFISSKQYSQESQKTPYEIALSRFNHMQINSPHHMLFDIYGEDFMKINYKKDPEEWKKQYYAFYFGLDPNNKKEYKSYIHKVCEQYLKTLFWNIQYYVAGCTSWSFH